MAKINVNDLFKTLSLESEDGVAEVVPVAEADNNKVSIRDMMEEQAEGHIPDDVIEVKDDKDITASVEEAEIEGVDDSAYMEEPNAIAGDVNDEVSEFEETADDQAEVEESVATLEAYATVLQGMHVKGYEISSEMAQVMRIGLESIDPTFFDGVVVSVEDAAKESSTGTTLSKIWAKIKQLWEIAKKLAVKMLDSAERLFSYLSTNTVKLQDTLKKLEGELKAAKKDSADMTIKANKNVMLKGKVAGASDLISFNKAIKSVIVSIPTKVMVELPGVKKAVHDAIAKQFEGQTEGTSWMEVIKGGAPDFDESVKKGLSSRLDSIIGSLEEPASWADAVFAGGISKSKELPGGKQISITVANEFDQLFAAFGMGASAFKIAMIESEETESRDEFEYTAERGELIKIAKVLQDSLVHMRNNKAVQEMTKAQKATYHGQHKEAWNEGSLKDPSSYAKTLSAAVASKIAGDVVKGNVQFQGHIINVIKSYVALLSAAVTALNEKEA